MLLKPSVQYHGPWPIDKKPGRPYFEGWYYKQDHSATGRSLAFIPGMVLGKDPHAFVQVIAARPAATWYFRFPLPQVRYTPQPFAFSIGDNHFTESGVRVRLGNGKEVINAHLRYQKPTPLHSSAWMPDIMGPFAYLPGMECNHGVLSLSHQVEGTVQLPESETLLFSGDIGYREKDWGSAFPKRYIWLQGNHFSRPGDGVVCSVATIPLGPLSFTGFFAALTLGGRQLRFATYTGANVSKAQVDEETAAVTLTQGRWQARFEGRWGDQGALKAPARGGMDVEVWESLTGSLTFTLLRDGKMVWQDRSSFAGMESAGKWK